MLKWGGYKHLVYKTDSNVKLINKAEYCQSVIADGKELITGNESGPLSVSELKDGNVFIIFKGDVTSFKDAFETCNFLTTIPDNLFADNPKAVNFGAAFIHCGDLKIPGNLFVNCPKVTDFSYLFHLCDKLTNIPNNLFDGNTEVTNFEGTFSGCDALTGESPYTMIGNKKVHLYERANYPDHFTTPTEHQNCFYVCASLFDFGEIPEDWK